MIVVACLISLLLPYEPDVRVAILLAGGPLLFGMLTSSIVAVLQSQLRMGRAVIGEVTGPGGGARAGHRRRGARSRLLRGDARRGRGIR
jgi:hypothetical protein